MDVADYLLCLITGFILICIIRLFTTWEFTVVVMFFWLCLKIELVYDNQKTISENQVNLEKLIKKEL